VKWGKFGSGHFSRIVRGCDTFGHETGKICWRNGLSGEVFIGHGVAVTSIGTDINPNSWLVVQPQSMLFSTRQILKCAI
jgi:hypothetical protein